MRLFELVTNEGKSYHRTRPTLAGKIAYIKAKKEQGFDLAKIIYTWTTIYIPNEEEDELSADY